ncbi:hypothetical protein LTS08_002774 [Lithohypha guttulata]|nr:hypothetical protein LTS08_002774 [Lithohypha guttulata]
MLTTRAVTVTNGPEKTYDMRCLLKTGEFPDFEFVYCGHTFHIHLAIVTRYCEDFQELMSNESEKSRDRETWQLDQSLPSPATIARLLYYLYTTSYPVSHIAHAGIKDFANISDDDIVEGRVDFVHVNMYAMGNKFNVRFLPDTAAQAFRELGHGGGELLKKYCWPELAAHIYHTSTTSERQLRIIVVRELQWTMNYDRALLGDGQVLNETLKNLPGIAHELAITPITRRRHECSACGKRQCVLVLPCNHRPRHEADDLECFKLGPKEQECRKCHRLDIFKE